MAGNVNQRNGNDVVTYLDLMKLADLLSDKWMNVGRYLLVPESKLRKIRDDNNRKQDEAIRTMLLEWQETNGKEATYAVLSNALRQAGRTDLAEYFVVFK